MTRQQFLWYAWRGLLSFIIIVQSNEINLNLPNY